MSLPAEPAHPRYQSILLFGAPGVGKGTQGEVLGKLPGFHHCSTGDMFRQLDKTSELGQLCASFGAQGKLVPDEVTIRVWEEGMRFRISAGLYSPAKDLLILDGLPRTVAQAAMIEKYVNVQKVIHLTCADPEEMVRRLKLRALKSGRIDDAKEEIIRGRWDVYQAETQPVLGCYPKELITDIEGIDTPVNVLANILAAVRPLYDAHTAK